MSEVHRFYVKGFEVLIDKHKLSDVSKYGWWMTGPKRAQYIGTTINTGNKPTTLLLHRFIINAQKGQIVDHINRNKFDNRIENLRFCTHAQNCCNVKPKGISKYLGVSLLKNKKSIRFVSRITFHKKQIYLGMFKTEIEAAKAYNEAAIKYHGEFANLNKFE